MGIESELYSLVTIVSSDSLVRSCSSGISGGGVSPGGGGTGG